MANTSYVASVRGLPGGAPLPLFSTLPEAAALVGIGRRQAYESANRGEFPGARRVSKRRWVVHIPTLLAHFNGQPSGTT